MRKTLIIENDRIDVLKDGYNIIDKTIHAENVPETLIQALEYAADSLDMDNMDAIRVLLELSETLKGALNGKIS